MKWGAKSWCSYRRGYCARAKRDFLPFFKLSPFQSLKSPRLLAWFVSSLGLLLHRSNVRSLSKPPVQSSEPPKQGIKRRFSNAIDVRARPAHTGNGRGSRFAAGVVGWWKNIHARFEVHSCYGSRDINVLKWKFGKCAIWSLFSYPVTYYNYVSGFEKRAYLTRFLKHCFLLCITFWTVIAVRFRLRANIHWSILAVNLVPAHIQYGYDSITFEIGHFSIVQYFGWEFTQNNVRPDLLMNQARSLTQGSCSFCVVTAWKVPKIHVWALFSNPPVYAQYGSMGIHVTQNILLRIVIHVSWPWGGQFTLLI